MSKHKKSKRRHRERSHRRRGHKRRHRSRDSSSSTDYSPRYKRRRSCSPGKTSDETRESSDSRERRSRSYSRDRSLSISKNTGHTPPPRERSPEKVLPVTTNSAEKTTDDNSSAGKKEVTISSSVTVVENQSTDGKADHNPKKGANDTPLTEEIVNVLGSRLKEDKEFSPAVHSHFVSIWKDIVQLGLPNDAKKELIKKYPIPINCDFLETPKLNKEIELSVNEVCKTRDKRIAEKQYKFAAMIASLSKILSHMISSGIDNNEDVPHIEAFKPNDN
ncbi:unnamed protein product [Trichogramma brassicae]|uniref:Uncharacterized protein n=1 Tax=Trichogramma brassicae TaxID=86971 RepID=A0A6H5IX44_9HYME|nr:unnamed protein product [Trichogramma brassicae]